MGVAVAEGISVGVAVWVAVAAAVGVAVFGAAVGVGVLRDIEPMAAPVSSGVTSCTRVRMRRPVTQAEWLHVPQRSSASVQVSPGGGTS